MSQLSVETVEIAVMVERVETAVITDTVKTAVMDETVETCTDETALTVDTAVTDEIQLIQL